MDEGRGDLGGGQRDAAQRDGAGKAKAHPELNLLGDEKGYKKVCQQQKEDKGE